MVPVGGAIIAGFNKDLVQKIRQTYPGNCFLLASFPAFSPYHFLFQFSIGRASSSQTLDVLITLLSMGSSTYSSLVMKAKEKYAYLKQSMEQLAAKYDEKVIQTPRNRISIGEKIK